MTNNNSQTLSINHNNHNGEQQSQHPSGTSTPIPPTPIKKKRRSLFRWSLKSQQPKPDNQSHQDNQAHNTVHQREETLTDPYRPIQWSPNRLATLYVTPSERNLYLAAMSQLDQNPPPLPLWSDPAPIIPSIHPQTPFMPSAGLPATTAFYGTGGTHLPGTSTTTGFTANIPTSPKLVTSPQALRGPNGGLDIREEFRTAPPKAISHALMAFTIPNGIKMNGFPIEAIAQVEEAILQAWPMGIKTRSESVESMKRRGEGLNKWRVELEGKVWKKQGHSELDSIRLMLAILSALAVHGWNAVNTLQAASSKMDGHNILFVYSPETQAFPPAFFALSIPLPDRISLISPPSKSTPALISAVRSAIIANASKRSKRDSSNPNPDQLTIDNSGANGQRVSWGAWKGGIKVEGWVNSGVYGFWLGGIRKWLGGGVKTGIVENLHPQLLITLINSLSSIHFQLIASLPLMPLQKGRDVLIFSSLPSSGLTYRDNFIPETQITNTLPSTISNSPVVVTPMNELTNPIDPGVVGNDVVEGREGYKKKEKARKAAVEALAASKANGTAGIASSSSGIAGTTGHVRRGSEQREAPPLPPRHPQPNPQSHLQQDYQAQQYPGSLHHELPRQQQGSYVNAGGVDGQLATAPFSHAHTEVPLRRSIDSGSNGGGHHHQRYPQEQQAQAQQQQPLQNQNHDPNVNVTRGDSQSTLIPQNIQGPRQRNVLVKKSSLRRRNSSGNSHYHQRYANQNQNQNQSPNNSQHTSDQGQSRPQRASMDSVGSRRPEGMIGRESWEMVPQPAPQVPAPVITPFAPSAFHDPTAYGYTSPETPTPYVDRLPGTTLRITNPETRYSGGTPQVVSRQMSFDRQSDSGNSVYQDAQNTLPSLPPQSEHSQAHGDHITSPLGLGQLANGVTHLPGPTSYEAPIINDTQRRPSGRTFGEGDSNNPANNNFLGIEPKEPPRGRVDIHSGLGISSMAGSVGYLPSTIGGGEGSTPPIDTRDDSRERERERNEQLGYGGLSGPPGTVYHQADSRPNHAVPGPSQSQAHPASTDVVAPMRHVPAPQQAGGGGLPEGIKRVWDEDRGIWVDIDLETMRIVPSSGGGIAKGQGGAGSSRTKVMVST